MRKEQKVPGTRYEVHNNIVARSLLWLGIILPSPTASFSLRTKGRIGQGLEYHWGHIVWKHGGPAALSPETYRSF